MTDRIFKHVTRVDTLATRRQVLAATGIGALLAGCRWTGALAQATPATAAQGGTLVVYSGRSEELVGPLLKTFGEQTGIDVEARYGDTAELAATILEEGDNSPADLFFSQDAGALGALESHQRFAGLASDLLQRVPDQFRSHEGMWVGTSGRARVQIFNTTLITDAELPASVEDLTDAAWKGKVGIAPTNGSFQSFITAFRVLKGEDAARSWLEGMIANESPVYESNDAIARSVGEGEIPTGLVNHYYKFEAQEHAGKSLPLENHYFQAGDVGGLLNVAGVGILSTARDAAQAAQLIDFLLQAEAQTYFATKTWEYPLVHDIPGPEDVPPMDELQPPAIDLGDLSDLEGTLALLADVGLL